MGYGNYGLVRNEDLQFLQNAEPQSLAGGAINMQQVMRPYEYFGYQTANSPGVGPLPSVQRQRLIRARALASEERWMLSPMCLNPHESVDDYPALDRQRIMHIADYTVRTAKIIAPLPNDGGPPANNQQHVIRTTVSSVSNTLHPTKKA